MRGALEGRGIRPQVFFLEARDDVLIRRFSETRHRHPLGEGRGIAAAIADERRLLDPVRQESDVVVDTSDLSPREQKILDMRFGLTDGVTHTLEEVGKVFAVTRERIRQIEAKAIRKLKHPTRARKLKDFLE